MELKSSYLLVFNGGSSSFKCALFSLPPASAVWKERVNWMEQEENTPLEAIVSSLNNLSISPQSITAIAHRFVHGGDRWTTPILLTEEIKEELNRLPFFSPLHHRIALELMNKSHFLFPHASHFAVFDTSFHATLPPLATLYPLPAEWRKLGIRRYGFHGISFQYAAFAAADFLQRPIEQMKTVICHIGAGASLCALKEGKSIDTTMGFTPLEGVMMATRCGSIDPGILLYLLQQQKVSIEELTHTLYFQSGLLGVSNYSADFMQLTKKAADLDAPSQLALDLLCYSVSKHIGSLLPVLQGIDLLIFTGGIAEHSAWFRAQVVDTLTYMGASLDSEENEKASHFNRRISSSLSRFPILVIPCQEEKEIARQCWPLIAASFKRAEKRDSN